MINPCSFFHYWQWLSFGVPPPVAQKQQLVQLLIFLTPPSELFSAVQFTEDFSHQSSPKPYFLPNCQVPVSPGKGMVVTSFCANLCEIFFFLLQVQRMFVISFPYASHRNSFQHQNSSSTTGKRESRPIFLYTSWNDLLAKHCFSSVVEHDTLFKCQQEFNSGN